MAGSAVGWTCYNKNGEAAIGMSQDLHALLGDLVVANRILAHEGVLDDFGHVAVRHPGRPDRFFISRSRSPELVTRDDLLEFTLDGTPVDPKGLRPYLESVLHARIFAARPDVNATVHHHAPAVMPYTIVDVPLRPIMHMASVLGGAVPVWDSRDEFGDTNMLIDDAPRADSLAKALGAGTCVLLKNHGAAVAAHSLPAAVFVSVRMKDNAELQARATAMGTPRFLTEGEIRLTAEMLMGERPLDRAWSYYRARAGFGGI
ncbi:HCOMODA/2-hydroxy-3-carboxy-muconic semialdehyde decarboxylase [Roseomonas rosea]|uniref:HCOMODA/2-hydroxy-3-carboxy-muconic semialdehyde decarboxylase n=1 Tax=Muricoccus roseus TaxID=198092 RepID=A0A1M6HJW2_9PROT|nr:class II aldolase/adducin family protein [Roseomonas rosea]SHJ22467.1 HCOMODA/2-hydroxy-3-carboxy-muconic semialdehyde decarboxylase [Roseomonas rosea]